MITISSSNNSRAGVTEHQKPSARTRARSPTNSSNQ